MTRLLVMLHDYLGARRGTVAITLLVIVAGIVLALSRLEYREDISDFLPHDADDERVNAIYRRVSNSNNIIIYFSFSPADSTSEHSDEIIDAIDRFTLLLDERDSHRTIQRVIASVDEERVLALVDFIRQHPPYFLDEGDYRRVDSLLHLDGFARARTRENKRLLMLPGGGLARQEIQADPLHLFTPLLLKLQQLRVGEGQRARDGHLFSPDGKKGMIILESPHGASETAKNAALVVLLQQIAREVEQARPGIHVTCFGAPVIAATNATRIKQDSVIAIALSAILILALLFYFFRDPRDILLVFLPVLFGWGIAIAVLAVAGRSISIIAIGAGSIFIGIAINYPLHFIDHLKRHPDRRRALQEITSPLLVGNITTVSAFLSLLFISSDAMRDMGLFGSLLLVGTILFVLVFLPHLLPARRGDYRHGLPFGRLAALDPANKRWIAWPILLLTLLLLPASYRATFDPDMNKINYMTDDQRVVMNEWTRTLERDNNDVIYLVAEGNTLDSALLHHERDQRLVDSLLQAGLVKSRSGIGNLLACRATCQQRVDRWNAFWSERRDTLARQLQQAARTEGFKPGAFAPFLQTLHADFLPRDNDFFAPVTDLLEGAYITRDGDRHQIISLLYCEPGNTAALITTLRAGTSPGTIAIDSRHPARRLVDALSDDFNRVLYICGIIVFLFLTLSFGRLELGIIAFLPLAVGWIWILGVMHLAGISFNIVNIILATFIFGQGDDYTIFITQGLVHERAYRRPLLPSYKNSIILSALVMFTGIGTLIFARHPALRSLAQVTIIGMTAVVIAAYLIPPLLFRFLTTANGRPRPVPVTLRGLLYSAVTIVMFLLGILALAVANVTLSRRALSRHICRVCRLFTRHIPGARFRVENIAGETFDRPAVIIANHQSHLDLTCLLALAPRVLVLVNDRTWNNPLYGRVIKRVGFYPVSAGIPAAIPYLAGKAREGYSILVFPEGTRSADCSIQRFHRGAFYIASQLQLDVLPVIIHGAGHVLPKHELVSRRGTITLQVHPRVPAPPPGQHAAAAKRARQFYTAALEAIARERQRASYFKSLVLHDYLYKGAAVEREARRMLDHLPTLQHVDAYSGEGTVLVQNNGNGLFSLLLALVHPRARIHAIEENDRLLDLARARAINPPNLITCKRAELPPGLAFQTTITLRDGWIDT